MNLLKSEKKTVNVLCQLFTIIMNNIKKHSIFSRKTWYKKYTKLYVIVGCQDVVCLVCGNMKDGINIQGISRAEYKQQL